MAENQTFSVGYGDNRLKCSYKPCGEIISSNTIMGRKVSVDKFEFRFQTFSESKVDSKSTKPYCFFVVSSSMSAGSIDHLKQSRLKFKSLILIKQLHGECILSVSVCVSHLSFIRRTQCRGKLTVSQESVNQTWLN